MYRVKTMEEFRKDIEDQDSPVVRCSDGAIGTKEDADPFFTTDMKWLCGKILPEYNPEKEYIVSSIRYKEKHPGSYIAPYMVTTKPHPGKLHRRFGFGLHDDDIEYIVSGAYRKLNEL